MVEKIPLTKNQKNSKPPQILLILPKLIGEHVISVTSMRKVLRYDPENAITPIGVIGRLNTSSMFVTLLTYSTITLGKIRRIWGGFKIFGFLSWPGDPRKVGRFPENT